MSVQHQIWLVDTDGFGHVLAVWTAGPAQYDELLANPAYFRVREQLAPELSSM